MPDGLKIVLFAIAGLLAGGMTLAGVEMAGHKLVSGNAVFIVAAVGLGLAGLVGGSVAALLSKRRVPAYVVGLLLACLSLVNVFSFKHPVWFVPVAFALLALGVWFAASRVKPNLP